MLPTRMALVCVPLIMAGISFVVGTVTSDQTTVGYAVSSLSLSLMPLLMLAWPMWALGLRLVGRVSTPEACIGGLGLLLMGMPPKSEPPAQPDEAIVVLSNVNAYSGNGEVLEAFFSQLQADAVITVERRAESIPGMVRVADNYSEPLPRTSYGSAAFCRDPGRCTATVSALIGSETMAMPIVQLRLADTCVLGIHAPPPYPRDPSGMHPYIDVLLEKVSHGRMAAPWGACQAEDPVVLAGDFNAVPGSPPYRRLVDAGLHDVHRRSGIYGLTWPTGAGWPPVPLLRLDYVFLGRASARLVRAIRVPDSDHKALVIALGEPTQ